MAIRCTVSRDGEACYLNSLKMDEANNKRQILFLRYCLQKAEELVEERKRTFVISFTGEFDYSAPVQREGYKTITVDIKYLDRVKISDQEFRFQEFNSGLRTKEDMLQYARDWKILDESLLCLGAEYDRADYQDRVKAEQDNWARLDREIDRLMACKLLWGLRTGERLHTSNLFAKHRNYRRAYILMREKQGQFAGIDLWQDESLPVGATQSLYEVWCLFKMLSIWINDYRFTLVSHGGSMEELSKQVHKHLTQKKAQNKTRDKKPVDLIVIKLEMRQGKLWDQEKQKGMTLVLEYEKKCEPEWNLHGKELRPDYFLTISYEGKTCRFCMDAKYRNYSEEQQGIKGWDEDVFCVAWFKYVHLLRVKDEENETKNEVNGSYILHSDVAERISIGDQKIGRYFWSKADEEQEKNSPDINASLIAEWRDKWGGRRSSDAGKAALDDDEILEHLHEELGNTGDCRFGSVRFTPLSDRAPDAAFRGLMQLMMEHFMGNKGEQNTPEQGDNPPKQKPFFQEKMYRSKCWSCGCEELDVKPLFTTSRFRKYYIKCKNKNCSAFWVQTHCSFCHRELGKHRPNYYRPKKGDDWNVTCPDCGKKLESE